MHRFKSLLFAPLLLASLASAQWSDIKKLGQGGESFVSTDGKGNVYVTSHQPPKLYASGDFGMTFGKVHNLPESFCDVTTAVGPDGRLYVIYIKPGVKGLQVMVSTDKGQTLQKGGIHDGPYDREWIAVNPVTGEVGFNYSDGYIGGPKSKGVFYAGSKDGGLTFSRYSRIDKEPEGSYAVDPYLTVGTGGRLYAAWATSRDYNTIDGYSFAASEDGGRTWINHTEIAKTHQQLGDTQERWMLGSIVAAGKDTVMAIYQDYASLQVNGQEMRPLLVYYRLSTDGGKTWTEGKPCASGREISNAMLSFSSTRDAKSSVPNYMQSLPWVCSDPQGRVHLAYIDNRAGQGLINEKKAGLWSVRFSSWAGQESGFSFSERVSHNWVAERPPLDFIGCASDGKYAWVTWTENPGKYGSWDFTGDLFVGRKTLP